MKSTIFFRNFTNLDYGYIDDQGMIHGDSKLLTCYMTGTPTQNESVVLDFSKGKKQIKDIIDDKCSGFDHKLLLFKESCYELEEYIDEFQNNRIKVKTPKLELDVCANSIRELNTFISIEEHLNSEMKKLYPDYELECKLESSTKGFTTNHAKYFRYSHGLKNSSSYGCQNPCHGHLSFVEVITKIQGMEWNDTRTAESIADYLNDAVIVFDQNIIEQSPDSLTVGYSTSERGLMKVTYKQPHKIISLNTETTIEYIIEFIKNQFRQQLKGKYLRISEGLMKGAETYVEL